MSKKASSSVKAPPIVPRKFGRVGVDCEAVLGFPKNQTHPRLKAHMFQIGKGGCALKSESSQVFVGAECLVWCSSGGKRFFEVRGRVVWVRPVYEGHEVTLIGIEFIEKIDVSPELLSKLHPKL